MRKRTVGRNIALYEKGNLLVIGAENKATGYGWLAYRAACAFPEDLPATICVFPPTDAEYVLDFLPKAATKRDKNILVNLCAVDGTELPAGWKSAIERTFYAVILMVNHSDLAFKCPRYVGEFYPKPRTLVLLEDKGLSGLQRKPPAEKVLGSVMAYHYRKGFDFLVPLMWKVYKKDPTIKFKLVLDKTTALLLRNGLPPTVEILSGLSEEDMLNFYLSLWAFFSLSMGEGGALPVAEAAVLSVPIITPNHTAFSLLPASVRVGCVPQPAPIDAHFAGDMFIPDINEVERVILESSELPPPAGGKMEFENVALLVERLAQE